jgi:hypothetical protein
MARAHASSVINAPIDQVWAHIRDFNGLANWHPAVAKSTIEGGGQSDRVGCVRVLTLQDGGVIRERLLEMSDLGHHYSYSILESPLPVANYRATLRLRRISDGNVPMRSGTPPSIRILPRSRRRQRTCSATACFRAAWRH